MSQWEQYEIEDKITAILREFQYDEPHHFGQPFASVYQIAIEFADCYPDAFAALNIPLGGIGSGENFTLPAYLSRELSGRIKSREITHIEGAWLSSRMVNHLEFRFGGETLMGSANPKYDFSMYRLRL